MNLSRQAVWAAAFGMAMFAAGALARAAQHPNILWIIAEDVGTDFACYGNPDVRTPNIDRLASQGERFNSAYSTAPVCSASRSAFCTGVYQTSFGAQHHRSHRDDGFRLPPDVRLVSDRLHEAGYFTANIKQLPPSVGFKGAGKTDWNFEAGPKPFDSDRWGSLATHQPFYAQVNLHETHRVYKRAADHPTDAARVKLPPYLPDHPVAREDWAAYFDSINQLDRKVGAILELLDREKLSENTIVFFFGDNGRECFRGKYFSYEQGTHVPLVVRWPGHLPAGLVRDQLVSLMDVTAESLLAAGVPMPARFDGRPFLDPQATPRQYIITARDRIDDTPDRVRTVREARYRYIRNFQPERPYLQRMVYADHTNPNFNLMRQLFAEGKLNSDQAKFMASSRPAEELYDLEIDPFELHDLARNPDHWTTLVRMRGELERWIAETHDQGQTPEDPDVERRILADHARKMQQQFSK